MKKLVVISNTPSPNTLKLREAVVNGARAAEVADLEIVESDPREATPELIMSTDGLILGTTENLGYMSGLVKDFFDRTYYPCLDHTQGLPFALYIRAGHDGTGTLRAIRTIVTGLRWKFVQEPLVLQGDFQDEFADQCHDLGNAMALGLDLGIL